MTIGFVFVLLRDCGCTNSERFLYRTSFGLGKYLPSQRNDAHMASENTNGGTKKAVGDLTNGFC